MKKIKKLFSWWDRGEVGFALQKAFWENHFKEDPTYTIVLILFRIAFLSLLVWGIIGLAFIGLD